jgi:putative flippase GtrA
VVTHCGRHESHHETTFPLKERARRVTIVVPVTAGQRDLELSIIRLHAFLAGQFPFAASVTIAAAGAPEATWLTAQRLASTFAGVTAIRTGAPGRGPALRAAWAGSDADVLAYLDPDLSVDLTGLVPLIEPLLAGRADLAVGTRLAPDAGPQRRARREITSCGYSLLLQAGLGTGLTDPQCGMKAITRAGARQLLPLTSDDEWFFDSALIGLARRAGLRVHEVRVGPPAGRAAPVRRLTTRLARFGAIGVACTAAYAALFLGLRQIMPAEAANAVSLLVTAIANTAANRRLTFGIVSREHALRHQLRGLAVLAGGLALTSGALALLHATDATTSSVAELAVVIGASAAATLLRFGLFSAWVFDGNVA